MKYKQNRSLKYLVFLVLVFFLSEVVNAQKQEGNINIISVVKNVSCFGGNDGSITIDNLNNEFTFLWATGETTNSLENLIAGKYNVQITSSLGSKDIKSFIINEPAELKIRVDLAAEKSNNVELQVQGGVLPYSYSWNFNVPVGGFLSTNLNANNGSGGIMFDVKAKEEMNVQGFDLNLNAGIKTILVYFKTGTYQGFENEKKAWQKLGVYRVKSEGANKPTHLSLDTHINVQQNESASFFIASANSGLKYNNINQNGSEININNEIQILNGIGRGSKKFKSTIFEKREFSGRVYYTVNRLKSISKAKNMLDAQRGNYIAMVKDVNGCSIATEVQVPDYNEKVAHTNANKGRTINALNMNNRNFDYSPNPTQGAYNLVLKSESEIQLNLELYDINGKKLESKNFKLNYGSNQLKGDISHLPNGVYILKGSWGDNSETFRIIKNDR